MILTCPSCGTQYVVKDGAIPPQGRQVRCASCKHSWHQDPEPAEELEMGPEMQHPEPAADESLAEATMIDPSTGPEAEERAYEEATIDEAAAEAGVEEPPRPVSADDDLAASREPAVPEVQDFDSPPMAEAQLDDDFSPFAERDYVEQRRRGPVMTILLLLLLVAALAAAFWFFAPPEWKARLGLTDSSRTALLLANPPHMELTQLESGNQLLTVAGRVINPTSESHPIPTIYAQFRNRSGKIVYRWTIAPPAPALGPGESKAFNSAEVNVPSRAQDLTLEISLGAPKA